MFRFIKRIPIVLALLLAVTAAPAAARASTKATLYDSYTNDANGDGAYATPENTPFAGEDVPFQLSIYNNGAAAATIDTISLDDQSLPPACAALINTSVRAGFAVSCAWTAKAYAPIFGAQRVSHASFTLGGRSYMLGSGVNTRNTLTVGLVNDANGDTVFTTDETALASGQTVPFVVTVSAVDYNYTITGVTLNGTSVCPIGRKGTVLAPSTTMTCSFMATPSTGTTSYTVIVKETLTLPGSTTGSASIATSTVTSP